MIDQKANKKADEKTDEEWVVEITNHPESAHWSVGKNIGTALSKLPDSRGFKILDKCWNDIAISVRKQILKGFAFEIIPNDDFFKVMNLGMLSEDTGSRDFAKARLLLHRR